MPRTYAFKTLDVFTDTPFKGNQLGIVTVPQSKPLSQSEKQLLATEFNYSESIFVHEPSFPSSSSFSTTASIPHVKVDIFTPESELPFAGHPTIGAVHHTLTHVHPTLDSVVIDLKAGPVLGKLDRATGFASAEVPQEFHLHGRTLSWEEDVLVAQPALEHKGMTRSRHALVSVVRGMNFGLVDLTEAPELLARVKVTSRDVAKGEDLDGGWPATLVGSVFFTRRPEHDDGIVRIDQRVVVIGLEDAATGSASCALTAHLAVERGGGGKVHRFELVQGEQMGRRSVIGVEITLDGSGKKVERMVLSGHCKGVMSGELEI